VGIVLAGFGFLFIQWYADQVITLNKHAERAGDARRKKQEAFLTKPMAKSKVAPSRVAPSVADGRAMAPATMRIEDMVVGIMAAKLGPIQVKDDRSIPGEFLTLKLRITNLSKRSFEYKSWSQRKTGIILCDQHKNYYNRIMIEDPPIVAQILEPGQTIVDMIAFEPPLKFFGYLDLDLPSHTYVPYVFEIPGGLVERELPKAPPPVQAAAPRPPTQAPPPAPVTYDPELDFKLKAQVVFEYKDGARSIERKINGMGYDRGRKFRLIAYEKLTKDIAESHNLTVDQVKRMIR